MSETLPNFGITKMKWARLAKVSSTSGSFDYSQKIYDWSARIREVTISVRSLSAEEEAKWRGFFLRVDGQVGTFTLTPYGGEKPKGAILDAFGRWKGTAVVSGSGQTGKTLNINGLPVSEAKALAQGDWFSLSGILHEVTTDVVSDAAGAGTVNLWRALAVAPANDVPLVLDQPTGTFKLLGDIPEMSWTTEQRGSGFSFRAREVLS